MTTGDLVDEIYRIEALAMTLVMATNIMATKSISVLAKEKINEQSYDQISERNSLVIPSFI